jgi:hypothetical protein
MFFGDAFWGDIDSIIRIISFLSEDDFEMKNSAPY